MLVSQSYNHRFLPLQQIQNKTQSTNLASVQNHAPTTTSLYTDIKLNKNIAGVFFTGLMHREFAHTSDKINKTGTYQCDTYFFRDVPTLEVMKDYLKENFPQGTHIADFGCSNGEETRTIAMILSDINKDNKYTITGYDPSVCRIDEADEGEYRLGASKDSFLDSKNRNLSPKEKNFKNLFKQYFRSIGDDKRGKVFLSKEDKFVCIDSFDVGNISDVDKILEEKKNKGKETGVVVFKNAWYHLMQNNLSKEELYMSADYDTHDLKRVLKKIHKSLPENGILVTGGLPRDHILGDYAFEEGIINKSPFHEALKECGFKPVETSAINTPSIKEDEYFTLYRDTKVYTIWKKAPSS